MKVIDGLGADEIFCLGDIIGKGAFPREVTDICRSRCSITLLGNHEDFFLKDPPVDYYRWAREQLTPDQLDWIKTLPLYEDRIISGRKFRFCHADPRQVHHRVYPRASRENKLSLFLPLDAEDSPPDILCYGDVHYAYMQYFSHNRILINSGSVGNPMDIPQAVFLLIRGRAAAPSSPAGDPDSPAGEFGGGETYSFEFIRVPYDIEREIRLTLDSSIPQRGREIYIEELRQGTYGQRWSEHS
jgi:hypothetical protein